MTAKPKHLITLTSLKSVYNNGIVNTVNAGVGAQAKRKKKEKYLKVTNIYKSTVAQSLSLQHAKYTRD